MAETTQKNLRDIFPIHYMFVFLVALLGAAVLYFYLINVPGGRENNGMLVGRDFVNLFFAGELLADGQIQTLFSEQDYLQAMRDRFGADYPRHNWSYPPTAFIPASFFATLPYYVSLLLWQCIGVVFIILAVRALRINLIWAVFIVLSPAGVLNILAGQNGFITAGLITFAGIYALRKPTISGLSWAMLTIKPHLGIVAVPMLLARRQWSVIIWGALFFGGLVSITLLVWGYEPWVQFFVQTTAQQRNVLEAWKGMIPYLVPTMFMQGRLLDLPIYQAYALHGFVAACATFVAVRAWPGRNGDAREYLTWFILATFLILPYSFLYDLVIWHIVLAAWHKTPEKLFMVPRVYAYIAWGLCWLLPVIVPIIVIVEAWQIFPIVLLAMLWQRGASVKSSKQLA